jgi:nitrogen regulatory protein P-II 1
MLDDMKYLIAIIEQERLGEVVRGIRSHFPAGEPKRMTVSDVTCYGHAGGLTPVYRGFQQPETPLPKVRVEMVLDEGEVQPVIDVIAPRTDRGQTADEGIVVLDLA